MSTVYAAEYRTLLTDITISSSPEGVVLTNNHIADDYQDSTKVPTQFLEAYGSTDQRGVIPWSPFLLHFLRSIELNVLGPVRCSTSTGPGISILASTVETTVKSGEISQVRSYCYALWKVHYGVDADLIRWCKGIARKLLAWHDMVEKSPYRSRESLHLYITEPADRDSKLTLLQHAAAIVLEKPAGASRNFMMKDLDRLPIEMLIQLLLHVEAYRRNSRWKSCTEIITQAFKSGWVLPGMSHHLCSSILGVTLGYYGVKVPPSTPWHALLWLELSRISKWSEETVRDSAWCMWDSVKSPARWIAEAKPSDLSPIKDYLGLRTQYQLELITGGTAMDWDNPLAGYTKDCGPTHLYHRGGEIDGNTLYARKDLPLVLTDAMRYIEDGHEIYTRYKGIKGVDNSGRTVQAAPIKGSLSRMIKDALYNHNIERHLLAATLAEDSGSKTPMWVPLEAGKQGILLDEELESKRVKHKEQLVALGQMLHNCVGTRKDTTSALYYWDGVSVVAEVKIITGLCAEHVQDLRHIQGLDMEKVMAGVTPYEGGWGVTECKDYRNSTTIASTEFTAWLREKLAGITIQKEAGSPMRAETPGVTDEEDEGEDIGIAPQAFNPARLVVDHNYSLTTLNTSGGISYISGGPYPYTTDNGLPIVINQIKTTVRREDLSTLLETHTPLLIYTDAMTSLYAIKRGSGFVPIEADMLVTTPPEELESIASKEKSWGATVSSDYDNFSPGAEQAYG